MAGYFCLQSQRHEFNLQRARRRALTSAKYNNRVSCVMQSCSHNRCIHLSLVSHSCQLLHVNCHLHMFFVHKIFLNDLLFSYGPFYLSFLYQNIKEHKIIGVMFLDAEKEEKSRRKILCYL